MHLKTFEKLCCPFDKSDLELQIITRDTSDNIIEGMLTCSQCQRYYPVISGIPIMSPDEYREKELEAPVTAKWDKALEAGSDDKFKMK